jgi:hypothetical protein
MTKVSILEELELQEEAYKLRYEDGYGWQEGAKVINTRHPEIVEKYGKPLSHMGFKRGVVAYEKSLIEQKMEQGIDPIEDMSKEFREAIRKNNNKINKLVETADEILQDALRDGTVTEKTRALKEVRDSLAQEVKNWVALQQYGIRQATNIGSINLKKEENIKTLIINWTDQIIDIKEHLCEECKKRVDELLNDLIRLK